MYELCRDDALKTLLAVSSGDRFLHGKGQVMLGTEAFPKFVGHPDMSFSISACYDRPRSLQYRARNMTIRSDSEQIVPYIEREPLTI